MKTKITATLLALALMSGCTSRTSGGECIGAFDDKKPGVTYKVSTWNVILGIIFIETVIVPVVVVLDQVQCPVEAP